MSSDSDIPYWGISLDGIENFILNECDGECHLHGLSTEDVAIKYLKPCTSFNSTAFMSYCEVHLDQPWIATATAFVSHAWSQPFLELVKSLRNWSSNKHHLKTYFWVDLFSNNQHIVTTRGFIWWTSVFRTNIESIGRTLLVLEWNNPRPLHRSWCLWEIFCSIRKRQQLTRLSKGISDGDWSSGTVEFEVIMSEEQEHLFTLNLVADFNSVVDRICNIDVRKAGAGLSTTVAYFHTTPHNQCFTTATLLLPGRTEDRDNIHEAIEADVGFDRLNSIISGSSLISNPVLISHPINFMIRNWYRFLARLDGVSRIRCLEQNSS